MKKQVLFIQGGGEGGYEADLNLVDSLQQELGTDYEISYPRLPSDDNAPDFGWIKRIGKEIAISDDNVILAAHSLGASMLLKYLSENKTEKKIAGIFLLAAPFWSGKEEWKQGLKLQDNFADRLPKNIRFFFYHCHDDEEVPFEHLTIYRRHLPEAIIREIETGGHLFGDSIGLVGKDIKELRV